MQLNNKSVLLTGASGGIGKALAYALAAKGANLFLHGRNVELLQTLQQSLPHPEHHQILAADLTLSVDREKIVNVITLHQGIDILINNAGTNQFAWLEAQSEEEIEQQLRVNVVAPILLTRALLPHIRQPGIVMNIGSSLGGIGYPGYSVYCASKFAIRGFSEALKRELADSQIKLLYFAPRATDTELNSDSVKQMNKKLGVKSDSAEWVAAQAICTLQRESPRRWLGYPERLFVKINALCPYLVDKALAKKLATIFHYAHLPFNK